MYAVQYIDTKTMDKLVEALIHAGTLRTESIIQAFRAIDRINFVPEESKNFAHLDYPIHIGYQQTISQPTTVAFMLELLGAKAGERILDIGSGSGWTTALLGHIVGEHGSVLGLERIPELIEYGKTNIARYNQPQATIEKAGTVLGRPEDLPYDHILISAAARSFPDELLSQVKEGGTIVLPVRDSIWKVTRVEHQPVVEKYEGYIFVPLITE